MKSETKAEKAVRVAREEVIKSARRMLKAYGGPERALNLAARDVVVAAHRLEDATLARALERRAARRATRTKR